MATIKTITLSEVSANSGPDYAVYTSIDCVNYVFLQTIQLTTVNSSVSITINDNVTCIKLANINGVCNNEVIKVLPTTTTTTAGPTTTTTAGPTTTSTTTLAPTTTTTTIDPCNLQIDYLVVAGGGGGGFGNGVLAPRGGQLGGGGGAGGLRSGSLEAIFNTSYNVVVGAGTTPNNPTGASGQNGGNSSLIGTNLSITSTGGGGGGALGTVSQQNGKNGGSGGGAFFGSSVQTPGNGIVGQGHNGGTGFGGSGNRNGGNGGGAGSPPPNQRTPGNASTWLDGLPYSKGGPGAGASGLAFFPGSGGLGGRSGNEYGSGGIAGVVKIRYAGAPRATGGTITQSGGFTFHTFTSNGTFVVNECQPITTTTTSTTSTSTTTTTLAPTTTTSTSTTTTTLAPTTTTSTSTTTTTAAPVFRYEADRYFCSGGNCVLSGISYIETTTPLTLFRFYLVGSVIFQPTSVSTGQVYTLVNPTASSTICSDLCTLPTTTTAAPTTTTTTTPIFTFEADVYFCNNGICELLTTAFISASTQLSLFRFYRVGSVIYQPTGTSTGQTYTFITPEADAAFCGDLCVQPTTTTAAPTTTTTTAAVFRYEADIYFCDNGVCVLSGISYIETTTPLVLFKFYRDGSVIFQPVATSTGEIYTPVVMDEESDICSDLCPQPTTTTTSTTTSTTTTTTTVAPTTTSTTTIAPTTTTTTTVAPTTTSTTTIAPTTTTTTAAGTTTTTTTLAPTTTTTAAPTTTTTTAAGTTTTTSAPSICVTSFGASMTPCQAGTADDHMEGFVNLSSNTPVNAEFTLQVGYIAGTASGNCNNLNDFITLSVTVAAGTSEGLLNCTNGAPFIDFGGATICSVVITDGPYPLCSNTTTTTTTTTAGPTTTTTAGPTTTTTTAAPTTTTTTLPQITADFVGVGNSNELAFETCNNGSTFSFGLIGDEVNFCTPEVLVLDITSINSSIPFDGVFWLAKDGFVRQFQKFGFDPSAYSIELCEFCSNFTTTTTTTSTTTTTTTAPPPCYVIETIQSAPGECFDCEGFFASSTDTIITFFDDCSGTQIPAPFDINVTAHYSDSSTQNTFIAGGTTGSILIAFSDIQCIPAPECGEDASATFDYAVVEPVSGSIDECCVTTTTTESPVV